MGTLTISAKATNPDVLTADPEHLIHRSVSFRAATTLVAEHLLDSGKIEMPGEVLINWVGTAMAFQLAGQTAGASLHPPTFRVVAPPDDGYVDTYEWSPE